MIGAAMYTTILTLYKQGMKIRKNQEQLIFTVIR